ncbi:MBOAT family O-acyltransferase [Caulobacter sp. KR2-114]|uniref:MBOAT family O-acyltransferase n=1 Tax=Caulobacter sp. KR2-114 TaxID=3400912 RepID=UPI003C02E7F1
MLFPTLTFGLFFLGLFAVAWAARRDNEWRKILLLAASWIFYGAWDWRFVALLIGSAVVNWGLAREIARSAAFHSEGGDPNNLRRRKALVAVGVAANLAVLGTFKYCGFFLQQVSGTLHALGWQRDLPVLQIVLPVGISFFTFQGMSYLIDIYRGKTTPARLLDVTLLMSFFAHLVAGPIVRASDLIPQFQTVPKLTREAAATGFLLIAWGLFKKAVIASQLATGFVDNVFFDPASHGPIDLIAATYGYAVQIYCDFSAYSDMAIGLAALLGYQFPRNFDQPYRAASLQDFWRRWHISLSSWLRDYLYISLGGNRGGLIKACRNLMITMLLGGLWHGASWTFVIWGALHGTVLAAERLWREFKPKAWPSLPQWIGVLVTFHIVCLAWIFFRADSFASAIAFLQGMTHWGAAAGAAPAVAGAALTVTPLAVALILIGLSTQALPPRLVETAGARLARMPAIGFALSLGVVMVMIEALRPAGVAPFIYYQF